MSKDLIKQDINFLEYPLWLQNRDEAHKITDKFKWEDLDGFVYESGYKPPIKIDIIFLYALLSNSQRHDWADVVELSRYELLKDCGLGKQRNSYWYDRLKDSLKRWMHVVITFEKFYDDGNHRELQFHIIEHWEINKKDRNLRVRFSKDWLAHIQKSRYFKMLDFEQIKALRSPLATRLYEILIKSFQSRPDWSCGAKKLAAKIPMKEEYPADIIPKIKTAVSRINEKTDLQIQLTVRRPKRGKAIFDFEKLESQPKQNESQQEAPKPRIVDVSPEQAENLKQLLALMPEKEQGKKTLGELVARKLRKHGSEFVRRNILYANKHAKSNYRVYLTKAFKEDWGEAYEEDLQEQKEARLAEEAAQEQHRQTQLEEERMEKQAFEQLASMNPEQKQALEDEARAKLEATNPLMLQGSFASAALKIQMNALLLGRIRES